MALETVPLETPSLSAMSCIVAIYMPFLICAEGKFMPQLYTVIGMFLLLYRNAEENAIILPVFVSRN